MSERPESVQTFLESQRIAVAGVARDGKLPANAIFKRLRDAGHEVFPINPNATEVEGVASYPDVASLPEGITALVVATHPDVSAEVVRGCAHRGIRHLWLHRSFGDGSVSQEAVEEAQRLGLDAIVGGCPLMFCEPVDVVHKCMRWWLQKKGRVPS